MEKGQHSSGGGDEKSLRKKHSRYWVVLLLLGLCALGGWFWTGQNGEAIDQKNGFEVVRQETCGAEERVRSVGIVGAGSGGASAAYFLNKFKKPCTSLDITVYERSDYIGGRSTTVYAYDTPGSSVELGASIFVEVNKNLVNAAEEFGLKTESLDTGDVAHLPRTIGVYNGKDWVFRSSESGWWTTIKILWKYGIAPIRTQRLMKQTVGKFLKMYDAPVFPFDDLSQTAYDLGLTEVTSQTGEHFLAQNNIGTSFAQEIIQASTRVNYAQNLNQIHGLETMVCMATDGAMSVRGGNWQIFAGLIGSSDAKLKLKTSVSSISRNINGTYTISTLSDHNSHSLVNHDTIIIAAPLQFANLTITPAPQNPPPTIPYVQLHVTLFTSPSRLRPESFDLPPSDTPPTTILTSIPPGGSTSLPYFSVSTLNTVLNPHTSKAEYLYKIFSPAPLSEDYIISLLQSPSSNTDAKAVLTWKYEKVWHSYPYLHPRITFEDMQLDEEGKVWYTSGIESFISTMETSSLMGMNVAKRVVDTWARGDGLKGKEGGDGTEGVPVEQTRSEGAPTDEL